MNIWWRWIKLVFTCGLGFHAKIEHSTLPNDVSYSECPRCHDAYYGKRNSLRSAHIRPSYWSVARGMYDRGIQ